MSSVYLRVGALHSIFVAKTSTCISTYPTPICLLFLHQLMAKAELTLEASYYNLSHDAWEPILEPVVDPDDESVYTPWTLQAEVLY